MPGRRIHRQDIWEYEGFGSEKRVVIRVGLRFLALVKPAIYAGFAISKLPLKSRQYHYSPYILCGFTALVGRIPNPCVARSSRAGGATFMVLNGQGITQG